MISPFKNIRLVSFALLCLALLFTQCRKNKKQDLAPYAEVHVQVKDQNNKMLDSAIYYVFENEAFYRNSLAGNPAGFVATGVVADGMINIPALPSGVNYFLLVRYFDTGTFPGFSILYTNEESTFFLPALGNEAVLNASLQLRPQEGLATFWTSSENSALLPISVSAQGQAASIINTNQAIESPKTIKLRKGNFMAQGTSRDLPFCSWQQGFQVTGGQNTAVEFKPCNYGQVIFYANGPADATAKIDVFVGINNQIGTLTSTLQGSCAGTDGVRTVLPPGEYSYYAKSQINKCAWSGKFNIVKGGCLSIPLENCGI